MQADELRRVFTSFFEDRGHTRVPSGSLIPNHPTAPMFTNSGMMPFVPYFLAEEIPPFRRATSVQKCVRLSGKHNDISELGRTRRHLTFFEMLGNFSFGDYFKADAIPMAWELVTEVVGFDGDRLWITVHEDDDEAEAIWRDAVGLPVDRIQRLGAENFWEMGETGPCGPCSEIHLDCGPEWGEAGGPAQGGADRYIEFWNLVFPQYYRNPDRSLSDLPGRGIDTGAGLERWLMLLQDVPTVFETDVVGALVDAAQSVTGRTLGGDERTDVALKVLADHARTIAFLISDGVVPGNEDRGYVLRRVLRRAVRFAHLLGVDRPVTAPLIERCVEVMGTAYPDLAANHDWVVATAAREEDRFRSTLRAGSAILDDELGRTPADGALSGAVAFKLHDTFGFPFEVTEEVAEERGVAVDRAGFDAAMAEQRRRARDARSGPAVGSSADRYRELLEQSGTTDFVGREQGESESRVVGAYRSDGGDLEVFLDRSPFYAEAGGQVGDTGVLLCGGARFEVLDTTFALPGLHRHLVRRVAGDGEGEGEGDLVVGQEVTAAIDARRRDYVRRNHTGTHLLHWALREVLGDHVKQQGSLVAPDHLRFDFSHHSQPGADELAAVTELANTEVLSNGTVRTWETTRDHAADIGAMAFFGDKYGEIVRVVEAGRRSLELCGGTHVGALGEIGPIAITAEGSIGANVRRLSATTGTATLDRLRRDGATLARAASLLGVAPDDLLVGLEKRLEEARFLRDEVTGLRHSAAGAGAGALAAEAVDGVVVA
nr:alanine--tRNA ligase [Acidimicrobiia bacterium]